MASVPVPINRSFSQVDRGRRLDEDGQDEEAEIWAALERLPTYDRLRTTLVERATSTRQERKAIQVKDVDLDQYFINELFKLNNPEEDNEKFLTRLRKRIDDAGVEIPTVEVRYENLKVEGQVHVGARALPTLTNTVINFFDMIAVSLGLAGGKRKRNLKILDEVTGVIKPGRLTLLLGPPGGGKTTFLLALAGLLESGLKCEGTIEYNGHKLNEFEPRKTSVYVSQNDLHAPELTVRETMDYSARYQGVGKRFDLVTELMAKEKELGIRPDPDLDYFTKGIAVEDISHNLVTKYAMKITGLDICSDTIVGDQMTRGISGGQRKRLTTGEMIVGPARAWFMDEISTGLDSSTTFQIVKCIRQISHILLATITISLLQPAPETYELFDDVLVLSAGHVIYHGPRENVEEFFESCGFRCPKRKAIPDFLQEVTSPKDQEQYWADKSVPYKFVPVLFFSEKFKNFHVAQEMQREMETPFDKTQGQKALTFDHWSLPQWDLFKVTLDRELLLMRKNWLVPVFNLTQLTVMGILTASLFFRTEMHHRNTNDAQKYSGALFFILNQVVFLGYAEITFTAVRFPLFHKLREMQFYPPWTWALSMFIIKIPFSLLESLAMLAVTYYTIGFDPSAGRFFKLWLVLALADQMGSGLFRMLAAFCRTYVIASSVGGFMLIILFTLGGYVIPRPRIRKWWLWGYWVAPLSYIQNAVINNEYLAPRWRTPLPGDRLTLGHRFIKGMGLFPYGYWYWMVCGALIAFTISFYFLFAASITIMGSPEKTRAQVSKAQLDAERAMLTGEGLEDLGTPPGPRSISPDPKGSLSKMSSARRASNLRNLRQPSNLKAETSKRRDGAEGRSDVEMTETPGEDPSTSSRSPPQRNLSSHSHSSEEGHGEERSKVGMILPFQPLALSFRNVNYYVDMPAERKKEGIPEDRLQLLCNITGSFRPGVLTALVGVTGAGKSTLMDVLAGRKNENNVEGDIRVSGYPKRQETFARIAGYCEQNDIHSPQTTVHEALIFSAWLRLMPDVDNDMKMEFVQQVMDLVELTPLKDAIVGNPGESGLSTEQRKRLTIAVELVANPSIIFMDEPTSGLDARAAATVMRAVRNTVDTGRTVVCTIHQPSIDIFDSFDELLLLKRGGQTVYHGPLGLHSIKLIEYFQGINGVPPLKEGVNPAAWMLEVSTPGMERKLGVDFAEMYRNSHIFQETQALADDLSNPPPGTEDLSFPTKFSQPVWTQFTCNIWRQNLSYWRSPGYNLMRILLSLASALFFGTVFWGTGKTLTTQSRLYSLMGSIFSSQTFYGVLTATAVQPLIAASRTVFYRERSAGMYSEFPYAIAQSLVEVPYILVSTVLYSSISYAMIKLEWDAGKFFWYVFFIFCSQITYAYWGMMTVSLTPTPQTSAILSGVFYNLWSLFSGFVLPHPSFPDWWRWIYWTDPISYHIYGTIVSQFGDLDDVYAISQAGEALSVKQLIRTAYGFKHSFLWFVALMSIMFPFLFAIMFVFAIRFLNYQQR